MADELPLLVRRFQDGDVPAFEALVDRFGLALARFAGHLAPGRGSAEDLLQEVWLKAWLHRESLRDPAKFKPWLYRIAHREALMLWRAGRPEVPADLEEVPMPAGESPEDLLVREEDLSKLMAHFQALPVGMKEVAWLSIAEGLSHAEIAKVLEIPEGTSRSRLHLALGHLKTALA